MIDVITWKWKPARGYRSSYGPETVNVLRRMVARNLSLPHRFSCITDDPRGIDSDIRVIPLWDTYANIPNPSSRNNPSCYRRLRMFSAEAAELIGNRIVSLDLDVVVTGDLTPLFDRDDDFVIWGGQTVQPGAAGRPYCWYNGSLMMLKAGTRTKVWDTFNPLTSPQKAHASGSRGSDQGWISHCLGTNESTWGTKDGIYSYRNHILTAKTPALPPGAKIVVFHGKHDPWHADCMRHNWVRENYR